MFAGELQVLRFEVPAAERRHVPRPELVEFVQQSLEWAIRFELGKAVEGIESPVPPLLNDYPRAGDPVRSLAVNEVSHDFARGPGLGTFIHASPPFRQVVEER